ncbi:MAG: RNA polymerase sigma factor [Gammaproteobacteria bacterium]
MTSVSTLPVPALQDDDGALVRRVLDGDRTAFDIIMRRYNRRLYRVARATLKNDAEAEDALQETYLRAYRSLAQFRADANLSTWLTRVLLNECFGRLRRAARRQNVLPIVGCHSEVDFNATLDNDTEDPHSAVFRTEMRELLERKVDALPAAFRAVFVLRSVEDISVQETAQCLDITEATVRSRHFRAKSLLRESLAQDIDLAERDVFNFGGSHCNRIVAAVLARLNKGEAGSQ